MKKFFRHTAQHVLQFVAFLAIVGIFALDLVLAAVLMGALP